MNRRSSNKKLLERATAIAMLLGEPELPTLCWFCKGSGLEPTIMGSRWCATCNGCGVYGITKAVYKVLVEQNRAEQTPTPAPTPAPIPTLTPTKRDKK